MTPSQELRDGWRSSHLSSCFGHEPQILAGQLCHVRSTRVGQATSEPIGPS